MLNTTIRSYEMRMPATSTLNSRDSSSWSFSIVELLQRCTENSVMGLIYLMQELLGAVSKASSVESLHCTKSTETFNDTCPCWPPCDWWGQINVYEMLAVLRLMDCVNIQIVLLFCLACVAPNYLTSYILYRLLLPFMERDP